MPADSWPVQEPPSIVAARQLAEEARARRLVLPRRPVRPIAARPAARPVAARSEPEGGTGRGLVPTAVPAPE